ncbi:ArsA-related P-loop ATPase [Deefgea piscis]|uniref:ArsA-related P-loop ATPase n=1 Tax=Deefgea piscis TaxID=2739061 RepID=UPI0040410CD3
MRGIEEQLSGACTTEIAAFDEFTALFIDSKQTADFDHIIFDTAPTGHTLLLLDATGAYHREVGKKMDQAKLHYLTPMMQLQDPKQTKVLLVTLAETTPVLEAANLQADLQRAGINPWAWVINNSIALAGAKSPLLHQRAQNELREIDLVVNQHA